jgi:hypothetical protein
LRGHPQGEHAFAVDPSNPRLGFQIGVVDPLRTIGALHHDGRGRQRGLDVAGLHPPRDEGVPLLVDQGRAVLQSLFGIEDPGDLLVLQGDPLGGLLRSLGGLGRHHCDRFTVVADPIRGQDRHGDGVHAEAACLLHDRVLGDVLCRDDRRHPGQFQSLLDLDRGDPGGGDEGPDDLPVEHPRHLPVGRVGESSPYLLHEVWMGDRGADRPEGDIGDGTKAASAGGRGHVPLPSLDPRSDSSEAREKASTASMIFV